MAHVATVGQPTAERTGRPAPPTRRRGGLERRKARTGLLLAVPAFVFVTVFVLVPVGFAVYLSFTDYPLIGPDHWDRAHELGLGRPGCHLRALGALYPRIHRHRHTGHLPRRLRA